MAQIVSVDFKDRIIVALTDLGSELWFPDFTYDLVQLGFKKLFDQTGITESEYDTTRVILKDNSVARINETDLIINIGSESLNKILLEVLPAVINEEYKESGTEFYTRAELSSNTEILDCVRDAFEVIRKIPTLFESVCSLVRSIHLIKPEVDDYDVSFSEPYYPFSIFVSIPDKNTPINALRVAEAIVHEAMHLQLTLIENIVELAVPSGKMYYSPWKEEYRTVQGVLHALYVFRVINSFFAKLLDNNLRSVESISHISTRINQIESELKRISDFEKSRNLTLAGKRFASRLIEEVN